MILLWICFLVFYSVYFLFFFNQRKVKKILSYPMIHVVIHRLSCYLFLALFVAIVPKVLASPTSLPPCTIPNIQSNSAYLIDECITTSELAISFYASLSYTNVTMRVVVPSARVLLYVREGASLTNCTLFLEGSTVGLNMATGSTMTEVSTYLQGQEFTLQFNGKVTTRCLFAVISVVSSQLGFGRTTSYSVNDTYLFTQIVNFMSVGIFFQKPAQLLNPTYLIQNFTTTAPSFPTVPPGLAHATIVIRDGVFAWHDGFTIQSVFSGGTRLIIHNVTITKQLLLGLTNQALTQCDATHNCTISFSNITVYTAMRSALTVSGLYSAGTLLEISHCILNGTTELTDLSLQLSSQACFAGNTSIIVRDSVMRGFQISYTQVNTNLTSPHTLLFQGNMIRGTGYLTNSNNNGTAFLIENNQFISSNAFGLSMNQSTTTTRGALVYISIVNNTFKSTGGPTIRISSINFHTMEIWNNFISDGIIFSSSSVAWGGIAIVNNTITTPSSLTFTTPIFTQPPIFACNTPSLADSSGIADTPCRTNQLVSRCAGLLQFVAPAPRNASVKRPSVESCLVYGASAFVPSQTFASLPSVTSTVSIKVTASLDKSSTNNFGTQTTLKTLSTTPSGYNTPTSTSTLSKSSTIVTSMTLSNSKISSRSPISSLSTSESNSSFISSTKSGLHSVSQPCVKYSTSPYPSLTLTLVMLPQPKEVVIPTTVSPDITASITIAATAVGGAAAAVDAQAIAVISLSKCAGRPEVGNYRGLSIVSLDDTCKGVLLGNTIVLGAGVLLSMVSVVVARAVMNKRRRVRQDAPTTLAEVCATVRAPQLFLSLCVYFLNSYSLCGLQLARSDDSSSGLRAAGAASFAFPLLVTFSYPALTLLFGARRLLQVTYAWQPRVLSMAGSFAMYSWVLDETVLSHKLFGCVLAVTGGCGADGRWCRTCRSLPGYR